MLGQSGIGDGARGEIAIAVVHEVGRVEVLQAEFFREGGRGRVELAADVAFDAVGGIVDQTAQAA